MIRIEISAAAYAVLCDRVAPNSPDGRSRREAVSPDRDGARDPRVQVAGASAGASR